MTDDLLAFVTARLDEDEAAAKANIGAGPGWVRGLGDTENFGPSWPDYQTHDSEELAAATRYLDRFRPLRALREVAAARRIIEEFAYWEDKLSTDPEYPALADRYETAMAMTRPLAAIWSDHPDYRQEWNL